MGSDKVIIRLYKTGDATGIYDMFTKYFPYKRDEEFWVWINRIIGGESIISIAEYKSQIIGHYAIVPRELIIGGKLYPSGLGIHAVVDPEYRNKVSIFEITNLAYQEAKRRGLSFIYGFPNANFRTIQEKLEKWKRISLFNAYEIGLKTLSINDIDSSIHFYKMEKIDYSQLYNIQILLEKSVKMKIYPQNDSRNWLLRYILHPQHLYKVYEIVSDSDLLGYVVTKDYSKEGFEYRHIVDYVFREEADVKQIICGLIKKAKEENADYYSVWKGDSQFEKAIKELDFLPTGFDTFLGVKVIDKKLDEEVLKELTDFSNWRLVMGDTDSF